MLFFLSVFTSFQVQCSLLPMNEVQPPQREVFKHHTIFCECAVLTSVCAPQPWMHCPRNTSPTSPPPSHPLFSLSCFRGPPSYHFFSQVLLCLSPSSISLSLGFWWFHHVNVPVSAHIALQIVLGWWKEHSSPLQPMVNSWKTKRGFISPSAFANQVHSLARGCIEVTVETPSCSAEIRKGRSDSLCSWESLGPLSQV